jgi:nitronate monooxygenase/enoyl-[acyl-carrier protein] reductase II
VIHTPLCDLLEIDTPVIQAPIWPATSPELVAAVGEAGAIGSIGAVFESAESVTAAMGQVRRLTSKPFIVNFVVPQLDEEAFEATLAARPPVVSFALGRPDDLVDRAHSAGAKVIHQVHTVSQAREAAAEGPEVIIAQGAEAGGQGLAGGVGTLALIPQVVDAVSPIPVVAAGAVADGRGLAAALAAGADGVNVGTRFLASNEAAASDAWKSRIIETESEDAVRFEGWARLLPPSGEGSYPTVPRVLRTEFVEEWSSSVAPVDDSQVAAGREAIMAAVRDRTPADLVPFTGQTTGLIRDVRPAGDIVRSMVEEAEAALDRVGSLVR